jgi:hypothetical protein
LRTGGERIAETGRQAPIVRFDVINTAENHERIRPARRPRRFPQPDSTAALRPSQRRAAANLAARHELRSTGYWLRRFSRL